MSAIVDDAKLLKPGDVVAVSFRGPMTRDSFESVREAFAEATGKLGIKFVLFEDADFTVLRPVDDEAHGATG